MVYVRNGLWGFGLLITVISLIGPGTSGFADLTGAFQVSKYAMQYPALLFFAVALSMVTATEISEVFIKANEKPKKIILWLILLFLFGVMLLTAIWYGMALNMTSAQIENIRAMMWIDGLLVCFAAFFRVAAQA